MKKAIGLVCLFFSFVCHASHDGPSARSEITPDRVIPKMPAKAANLAKDSAEIPKVSVYGMIYTESKEPVTDAFPYPFESCARYGGRLPNLKELETIYAKHPGKLPKNFDKGCVWSSTKVDKGKNRYGVYFPEKKSTGWGDAAYEGCSTICIDPEDPVQDIIRLCPVGAMDYCKSGKGKITNCEGKQCTPDFRCICGDFSLVASRCMENRMGRKSWSLYTNCKDKAGKIVQPHATNIIRVPYPGSSVIEKYCGIEPQSLQPGGNPVYACWVQTKTGTPAVPNYVKHHYCGGGATPNTFTVYGADTNYYDDDYADSPSCLQHMMYTTGIPAEDLLPP